MLRDYEAELKETAEKHGRSMLQVAGMADVRLLVNRVDLTSDEVLNRITVIVEAVQKLSQDESIPWEKDVWLHEIENDPFAEGQIQK